MRSHVLWCASLFSSRLGFVVSRVGEARVCSYFERGERRRDVAKIYIYISACMGKQFIIHWSIEYYSGFRVGINCIQKAAILVQRHPQGGKLECPSPSVVISVANRSGGGDMINARHNSRHKHWTSFANFNTRLSKTVCVYVYIYIYRCVHPAEWNARPQKQVHFQFRIISPFHYFIVLQLLNTTTSPFAAWMRITNETFGARRANEEAIHHPAFHWNSTLMCCNNNNDVCLGTKL